MPEFRAFVEIPIFTKGKCLTLKNNCMKKLYVLIAGLLFVYSGYATVINVSITNFQFTPASFTAVVGDTVLWTNNAGATDHTASSTSTPGGVSAFNSGTLSPGDTFSYVIPAAGSYAYQCNFHPSLMTGSFTATMPTGVKEIGINVASVVYPNPFKNKITVTGNDLEMLSLYNITGKAVKSVSLNDMASRKEIDLSELPAGVYFYTLLKDGVISETKKIVKCQ